METSHNPRNGYTIVSQLLSSPVSRPDYQGALGRVGRRIEDNRLRAVVIKEMALGIKMIRLSNGMPCPDPLPITGAQFSLRDGTVVTMDQNDMDAITSYNYCEGIQELRNWLTELTRLEHKPPQLEMADHPEPFDLTITNGSTDATRGIFHIMLDEGDSILLENDVYSTTIGQIKLFGANPVTVDSDEQGMLADHLESILSSWPQTHPKTKRPRVLFAITSCNNPTSYTWHEERLAAVYLVCRKYDVIILEDGAYYFLQFGERKRSFQSLDVDGRVVRMDTFSKLIGAGYRLGWISGPATIISRYLRSMAQNTIHPSVLSQLLVYRILHQWGHERFQVEVKHLAAEYKKRAQLMVKALEKYCTGKSKKTIGC
ncbi:unnamed protein product [Lymnaea stagnalis]|uniref:Aminotransferase class I/classII large domain-containing protein n=1 Tax=Lymnaea stagnalis TaxID=6523 RepID=A0AAV2HP98_LYMST